MEGAGMLTRAQEESLDAMADAAEAGAKRDAEEREIKAVLGRILSDRSFWVTTCPECDGGVVADPAWRDYFKTPADQRGAMPEEPEEIECGECEGRGEILTRAGSVLAEALGLD